MLRTTALGAFHLVVRCAFVGLELIATSLLFARAFYLAAFCASRTVGAVLDPAAVSAVDGPAGFFHRSLDAGRAICGNGTTAGIALGDVANSRVLNLVVADIGVRMRHLSYPFGLGGG